MQVLIAGCTTPFWLVSAKNHLSESFHLLSKTLSCLFFLWTTKHNLLLNTSQDPVLALHQGILFLFLSIPLSQPFAVPFLLFTWRPLNGLDCQVYSLSSQCPKTRPFITNVTLLTSYFVYGPLSKFVLSIFFDDEVSVHAASVSVHSEWRILHGTFRRTKNSTNTVFTALKVLAVTFIPWSARDL